MKKVLQFLSLFALCALPLFAKEPTLEQTLKNAATKISESIDGKVKTVAVIDIRSEFWALSDYMVGVLNDELTNVLEATNVAERDEYSLALIQTESDYQLSGNVSDETIQEIGQALGADCIVLGDMKDVSGGWELTLRASTVESKKVLVSARGKVSSKEKEVKFQIKKSKEKERPIYKLPSKQVVKEETSALVSSDNPLGISASLIDENGRDVTILHPNERIRFRVSSSKDAYLAILCVDAKKEETWLPLSSNFIRAGESRVFPDIQGVYLSVEKGVFGKECVKIYAAMSQGDLPTQTKMMGTRGFTLSTENAQTSEFVINYEVKK